MKKKGKFAHHHGKAGEAFAKGDKAAAMHHVGHMMAALRTNTGDQEMAEPTPDAEGPMDAGAEAMPPKGSPVSGTSIRDRLKGFRKP